MIECIRCGFKLPQAEATTIQPLECPTCGKLLTQQDGTLRNRTGLIRNYFLDVWKIITQPTAFFRHMPLQGGLSRPLGFALMTHWIGVSIGFLWSLLLESSFEQVFRQLFKSSRYLDYDFSKNPTFMEVKDRVVEWLFGAGPIIADPFFTLGKILVTSSIVFIGARILVSPGRDGHPKEVTFESTVRIICFGMTPAILAAIPWVGGLVSSFGTLILTVIAAKEAYHIHLGRAILVALFPKLFFLGIIGVAVLFFIGIILNFFAMVI